MMLTALLTYHSFQKIVGRPDKKKEAMFSKAKVMKICFICPTILT